ncbi:MAG: hypothetical protein JKY65_26390 [Planctomycetes bacterium]|nr:hypothetical protein [Planctomycetota bacterium]
MTPRERTLLLVCVLLDVAACLLAGLTGAGEAGIFAVGYLSLAGTCALLIHEHNRPIPEQGNLEWPGPSPPLPEVQLFRAPPARPSPLARRRLKKILTGASVGAGAGLTILGVGLAVYLAPVAIGVVAIQALLGVLVWVVVRTRSVKVRSLQSGLRCALCRDGFDHHDLAAACLDCETNYHTACWSEWPRCALLGCPTESDLGAPFRVQLRLGRDRLQVQP